MFSTLEEQIESTQGERLTPAKRWIRRLVVFGLSLLLFIAVLLAIGLVDY